ncbi:uncharacterized protein [Nicotiana tomentosiformis]|uniref:uncharacterized protein n=1 Tax=Nicotiana tomentosiformis TaxID=4098 RepID=UPI00388C83D4
MQRGGVKEVTNYGDGVLKLKGRIYIPNVDGLRELILEEAHSVKYECQRPGGLLKKIEIPEWKWERITMDSVVGLPQIIRRSNAIWVIVQTDQLDEDMAYEKEPVAILDMLVRKLSSEGIRSMKVQWRGQPVEEILGYDVSYSVWSFLIGFGDALGLVGMIGRGPMGLGSAFD